MKCFPELPVIFTFSVDDGHPSDMKMANLLSMHGLPATFFIPIVNDEGQEVLPPHLIRELGQAYEIGSHTFSHCFLNTVSLAQAKLQISGGKSILENVLGRRVDGFCYPGGRFRQEHAALVESAGFTYARTTMNLCFDAGVDCYRIPTSCQFYPHDRGVYFRNFASGGRWRHRLNGLSVALSRKAWTKRLYGLFDHAHARNSVFHLWGHSRDIDRLNAWDELTEFFAYVQGCVPVANRLSNGQLAARFFPISRSTVQ